MENNRKHTVCICLVNICRFVLGLTFLFSGFVKAIDPLGSFYKIQDYLTAFHLSSYLPEILPLYIGLALSIVELCTGMFLVLGIRRKISTSVALGLMIFMTPLTLYLAISNPVADCGCFGDALVLTNWETFFKNVILLAAAVIVFRGRKSIIQFISFNLQWIISLYSLLFAFFLSAYCLLNLPLIDFRPYKVGVNIPKAMEIPENAKRAVYDTKFVMEKEGKKKEFTLENYPDSTWKYVETISKLIEKGYEPPIHDFNMTTVPEGEDVTEQVLSKKGYTFLLVLHRVEKADDSNIDLINGIYDYAKEKGYPFYALTSSPESNIQSWVEQTGAEYPFLQMDDITLKTMIRSNPGLILLKDGTIYNKWSDSNIPDESVFSGRDEKDLLVMKQVNNWRTMGIVLLWFIVPLFMVIMIDTLIIHRKKNRQENHK